MLDLEAAARRRCPLVHPDLGTNKSATWVFDSGAAGTGGDVDEADRGGRGRRTDRDRAAVPPAAADPGVHGAALASWSTRPASRSRCGRPPRSRTSCGSSWPRSTRASPSRKIRVIAPDVGGGFGGKLQVTPEEMHHLRWSRGSSASRSSTPRPARESLLAAPPRPRPDPGARRWRPSKDGTVTGLKVDLLADMGAYLGLVGAGRPDPRRVHVQRDLQVPGLPVHLHERLHQQDLDRRLPRRRPARGDVRHRADDGRARRRARASTRWSCARRTGSSTRSSRSPRSPGSTYDSGNYEAATAQGQGAVRLRRAARRAGSSAASAATRSSSASASRRSPRCAAWRRRGCSARSTTAAAAGSTRQIRMLPTGKVEVVTGVSPRTARATRRRSARSSPTGSACRSRTSRSCTATPRSRPRAWTPTARARWSSAAIAVVKAADKVIEKAKHDRGAPARGDRGRHRVRRRHVHASGHRQGHDARRDRVRRLRGAQPARRHRARRSTPTRPSTRRTSPSRTARTCARSRSTPRPGRSTIRKYVCVDDIGNVVNPLIVEGQVHGGLAQGIAQALFEEAVYDESGHAGHRHVRRLPAADGRRPAVASPPTAPRPRRRPTRSGVKGVGEAGTIASTPADRQRGARRAAPPRRQRHRDAVHARSGCGGPSRTANGQRRRQDDRRSTPHSPGAGPALERPERPARGGGQ